MTVLVPLRALARHRGGVVALEFALIGSALIFGALLVLELGWQLTVEMALQSGAREASRYGVTGLVPSAQPASDCGNLPGGNWRTQQIIKLVIDGSGCLLQASYLSLTMKSYASFAAIKTSPGADGAGGSSEAVKYTLNYSAPMLTTIGATLLGSPIWQHQAVVVVKNEPFPQ